MGRKAEYKTFEQYCLDIAADVTRRLLKVALKDPPYEEGLRVNEDPFSMDLNAERDGRIANRVYRELQEKGVLDVYHKVESNDYYGRRRSYCTWRGQVNKEWFNKNAPKMAVEPKFEIKTKIKKETHNYNFDETELANEDDSYVRLQEVDDAGIIWIYYHFDDYDFKDDSETWDNHNNNTHTHTHTSYFKTVFPKKLLMTSSVTVYLTHVKEYLKNHIEWAVEHVLGIKGDEVINKLNIDSLSVPDFKFEKEEWRNKSYVTEQIGKAKKLISTLNKAHKSLVIFRDAMDNIGGWKVFERKAYESLLVYLKDCYPLHIGANESNEDLKKLCEMIVLGKDRGVNPRLQEIEKTTDKQEALSVQIAQV